MTTGIKSITATYTGGGVYIYYGALEDDTFFLFDNECPYFEILDEMPDINSDECFTEEWYNAHWIKSLDEPEALDAVLCVLNAIITNGCTEDSNYLISDVEHDLARFSEMA